MRSWHIAAAVTVRGAQPPLSRGAAVCTLPGGWPGAKAPGRPRSGAEGAPSLPGSRLLPTRAGACWQLEIGIARAPGRFYTQAAAGAGPGTQAASGRAQGKAPEPLVQRAQCTGTVGTGTAVTGKVRTDLWPGPPALPAGAAHFRVRARYGAILSHRSNVIIIREAPPSLRRRRARRQPPHAAQTYL